MGTKKYDLFMAALQHLCEVHDVNLEVTEFVDVLDLKQGEHPTIKHGFLFLDYTKEPS